MELPFIKQPPHTHTYRRVAQVRCWVGRREEQFLAQQLLAPWDKGEEGLGHWACEILAVHCLLHPQEAVSSAQASSLASVLQGLAHYTSSTHLYVDGHMDR